MNVKHVSVDDLKLFYKDIKKYVLELDEIFQEI